MQWVRILVLILISALPIVLLFFWLNTHALVNFLLLLLAGICSLILAALIQQAIPAYNPLFTVFVRGAFVEELGRLILLLLFLQLKNINTPGMGMITGFGFAFAENIAYGIVDMQSAFLRVITTFPLHGSCGSRVAASIQVWNGTPARAVLWFVSAVTIHGTYNITVINEYFPWFLPVLIAFFAFASSLYSIHRER
ncbi:MAG: PrsW family intramembrane metalloprotease [Treponema sp.]|jgi:hypothetical protein|nr:PrsW family intramembrane metalloprotease [Treponema sp.]